MSYEDNLREVGGFGRFQKLLCFYLLLSSVPNGYLVLSIVFSGYNPPLRCYVPNNAGENVSERLQRVATTDKQEPWRGEQILECNNFSIPTLTESCLFGVTYDIEPGRSTFVTEFNMVCSRASMRPLLTSVMMFGVMIGSALSGVFADRYGRRPVFLIGTLFMFLCFGLCGFASSVEMLVVFLFFAGGFNLINYATAFVLASEITRAESRVTMGVLTIGGFAMGYMIVPPVAYFISNWRHLYIAISATGILFIPFYWIIPESPRWLYVNNRTEEYKRLMSEIAKCNGRCFTATSDQLVPQIDSPKPSNDVQRNLKEEFVRFIGHKQLRFRFLNMSFTWFANAIIYYGLSLNTSNLGGNAYLNCFLAALVEIPAYAFVLATLNKIGRKTTVATSVLVSGVACGLVPFVNEVNSTASVALAMIGKFSISLCFVVIYIYASELFPTVARNSAVGLLSMCARVGATVAPLINYAGETDYKVPYVVMMGLAGVSAAGTLFLPETSNHPMPEKLEDMQSYSNSLGRICGGGCYDDQSDKRKVVSTDSPNDSSENYSELLKQEKV